MTSNSFQLQAIATTEDYTKNIAGGCEFLWTDFGFPMCRKAAICFLGFKNKDENRCLEKKKFKAGWK